MDGQALIAGCASVALSGTGNSRTAICATSAARIGTHNITARYGGDGANAVSTSDVLSQVVEPTTASFSNGGFEIPNLAGGYRYNPVGGTWVFGGGSGISGNNTPFTSANGPAPEGIQVGLVQGNGAISQTANFQAANYVLTLSAAQRLNYQFGTQVIAVQIDGVTLAQFQPPQGPYATFITPVFNIGTSGNHTISLVGAGSGSDYTGFVDSVRIVAQSVTSLVSSANPAVVGSLVALTSSVSGAAATGTVAFLDGATPIPGCEAIGLSGSGAIRTASCSTVSLAIGTHPIVANYSGDGTNSASSSQVLSQVITPVPANVPPTVSLTAPVNGASYVAPASITLTATATDSDGTISKVEFLQGATVIGTVTNAPYTFNWSNVTAGSYTLTARATDNANAVTTSSAINVTVTPANAPPTVSLTAPVSGASYVAPASITLTATAADSDGTISKVEFLQGTTVIGTVTSAPYTFAWTMLRRAVIRLTARATDNGNAVTTSSPVNITVTPPANVPPTVSLTAPVNGASYVAPASITLTATAADSDGTISKVEFLQGTTVIGTVTSAPYTFAWTNVAAGSYALTARATDNGNAVTTSSPVNITVTPANTAPTVSLTAPVNGASYVAPASITLTATAADSDGTVSKVEFLQGTTVIATLTSAPYTFSWTDVGAGTYTLTARATDNNNAVTTSSAVLMTVGSSVSSGIDVALQGNGGVATATSTEATGSFPASAANDGNRNGGGWQDGTPGVWPDTLEVDFSGLQTLNRIDVFTLQDEEPGQEPTPTLTFTRNGITAFEVQSWDGAGWVTVPGGVVTGNDKVWRSFGFAPLSTDRIRVVVSAALGGSSRITEVEAWTAPANVPPTVTLTAPVNGDTYIAPASITLTATAADSDGTISKVEFLQGATVLAR